MVETDLVEYEDGQLKGETTEKGLRFRRTYNEIGETVLRKT
jgi:predicted transcriptional regulator